MSSDEEVEVGGRVEERTEDGDRGYMEEEIRREIERQVSIRMEQEKVERQRKEEQEKEEKKKQNRKQKRMKSKNKQL